MPLFANLAGCGNSGNPGDSGSAGGPVQGGDSPSSPVDSGSSPSSPVDSGDSITPARVFVHPGLLHTEADFTRMREKVAAGAQPWVDGWNALTRSSRTNLGTPNPQATIIRGGDGENFRIMVEDMLRAYQGALRWKVSGDTTYADKVVTYLDAWSSTMTTLTGNADRFLAAGIYGYQWANAAEIMRTYEGWSAPGIARFQQWLLDIFYPLSHDFLLKHNGADITNYWANWDLCSLCNILAIGVFCDRADLYDEAMAYYRNTGRGNGAAAHAVYCWHPGHFGQWQESGRDQGHATLGIALTGPLCEMAWNQGDDLYGFDNNRFLAGAEYVAKSNLLDPNGVPYQVPFSRYVNRQGTMTAVSTAGQPAQRRCWEMVYNHYVNRQGLSAPWVAQMAAALRPETDQWNGDQPSMGTLTFSRDAIPAGAAPSGLTAHMAGANVVLSWWGGAYATSYQVQRASAAAGPFATIGTVTDLRTWTDTPGNGAWYYRVVALASNSTQVGADTVRVALPTELRALLPLNEGGGSTAADASGLGNAGTLATGASWGSGRVAGSALALDGKSGHLALPTGVLAGLGDFTIAVWVYWNAASTNTRVFDFGSSDIAYLALIPRDGGGRLRCSITGTMWYGEQTIAADAPLATGRWVHLAVTLAGSLGTLYVDGAAVASNPSITFAPFQLGATTQNWLGRSQYAADPCFNGRMQDLRICSGALDAGQVAALAV
ncbi:LamG-like jellyroll fold domain-containing protein [Ideonella sp.]|uniref:LamG-like jellyroll fold domain-containing protein n=1 Tax=Ideonella sp. TaxID=1929293 RepID=UPI002B4656FB|nr:LamG-like jellyroll fold domain-containing protein [Ideonella sp.]HJV71259.1 LamG-like jellyroll fold domain-containing protein [Ideonella sp.]